MEQAADPTRKATRLRREDWVLAGFVALAAGGAAAIRVETLAREIGSTKGSFYWHFRDLNNFLDVMLQRWEALATRALGMRCEGSRTMAHAQLRRLLIAPWRQAEAAALEAAMRDWAATDPRAASALRRVDAARLSRLGTLLAEAGLSGMAARHGARDLYATGLGELALAASGFDDGAAALERALNAALADEGHLAAEALHVRAAELPQAVAATAPTVRRGLWPFSRGAEIGRGLAAAGAG